MANNATCLNNNARYYQSGAAMGVVVTLCVKICILPRLKESINWKLYAFDDNEYRSGMNTERRHKHGNFTYSTTCYILQFRKLLTAPSTSPDCRFPFTFKPSSPVTSERGGVLSVRAFLAGSKIESSEITARDSFCEGASSHQ